MKSISILAGALATLLFARSSRADDPREEPATEAPATPTDTSTAEAPPAKVVVPPESPERKQDLRPHRAEAPELSKIRFTADPVGDGAVIAIGATFGILSSEILSTDEIRPQQISPTFDTNRLLGIDRGAIRQTPSASAKTFSNIGVITAVGYAALDVTLDVFREGKSAALVDAIMYTEAFILTQGVTNIAKIAFRRPRPIAYIQRNEYLRAGGDPNTYDNAEVDSSLSFVSGHTSQTAAMAAAATYIAFSREPGSVRAWSTLVGGTLLTGFVGYERVRAAAHFPTDVIAGAAIGAGIGALVVHMHREDSVKQRPVWIGAMPMHEGGMLSASGIF